MITLSTMSWELEISLACARLKQAILFHDDDGRYNARYRLRYLASMMSAGQVAP